uniref:Uncharacterized protein n=1 Tax=Spongospora subterranea TaxID=70186 RepID=A0A0H5RR98_9EUKA|eukprot:CRZ11244.1 hypothetical protein [Spongospora subterranea]
MWRAARQMVARVFFKRKLVGNDKLGNQYFVEPGYGGYQKRCVDYAGRLPDPRTIPWQWARWLRGQRSDAPTADEMAAYEKAVSVYNSRIQKVEEAARLEQEKIQREGGVVHVKGRPYESIHGFIEAIDADRQESQQKPAS